MENLERLASSVAQVELLVASLKRENRDLANRLGASAQERRQAVEAATASIEELRRQLETAVRQDPGLEARAHKAELESAELPNHLELQHQARDEERARLEGLVRQLEAQLLAQREQEQLPVAAPLELEPLKKDLEQARAAFRLSEDRVSIAEHQAQSLKAQLEQSQDAEGVAVQQAEAVRARLLEAERRVTSLESAHLGLERELGEAQRALALLPSVEDAQALRLRLQELEGAAIRAAQLDELAGRLESDKASVRVQRKELAAYAKERQTLKRRVEELMATLENVRLG